MTSRETQNILLTLCLVVPASLAAGCLIDVDQNVCGPSGCTCQTDDECGSGQHCGGGFCLSEYCGDGILQTAFGEVCDLGAANTNEGACTTLCRLPRCGDGFVQAGETCDDANTRDADGCDHNCSVTGCGNGIQTPGEDCDDGNLRDGDGCEADCSLTFCTAATDCTFLDGACSAGYCDASSDVCLSRPTNEGLPCDDGDACTSGTRCAAGLCKPKSVVSCEHLDTPCSTAQCDRDSGTCALQQLPDDTPCDDGDACTQGDACSAGQCTPGAPRSCDDGDACTSDSCAADVGCSHTPAAGPCGVTVTACGTITCTVEGDCTVEPSNEGGDCDDGNACTQGDICHAGACEPTTTLTCDDGNPCTSNTCDPLAGCTYAPEIALCDDDNVCTQVDICINGACVGTTLSRCDDGNPCTVDVCAAQSGCSNTVDDTLPCDDGFLCTTNDACNGGTCAGTPDTTTCDDGLFCNGAETCVPDDPNADAEGCLPGTAPIVSDGIDCTSDNCDEDTDTIAHTPNDASCGGTFCAPQICDPTQGCVSGDPPSDDGVDCTDDSCDEAMHTITHSPNDSSCAGGTFCAPQICDSMLGCQATERNCDDGNGCTVDNCDNDICTHVGKTCDDGDACTVDACDNNICTEPRPSRDCDDGNDCTTDGCDPASGCTHGKLNGTSCDDGNACTKNDVCTNGICGGTLNCDDGEVCTEDACANGACTHDNAPNATCDDGNLCTEDACVDGACVGTYRSGSTNQGDSVDCSDFAGQLTCDSAVTWWDDIQPLTEGGSDNEGTACSSCHGAGSSFGAFGNVYAHFVSYTPATYLRVRTDSMPSGCSANQTCYTTAEKNELLSWFCQGMPEGTAP